MSGISIGQGSSATSDDGIAIGRDITAGNPSEAVIRGASFEVAGRHPSIVGPRSSHLRLRDVNGDRHELSVNTAGQIFPALATLAIDVQTYAPGSYTWTKPDGAQLVYIVATGAGSGGCSGISLLFDPSDPDAYYETSAGGRGGSRGVWLVPADELPDSVPVEVAEGTAGGVGGAATGAGWSNVYVDFPAEPDPTFFGDYIAEEGQYPASRYVIPFDSTIPGPVVLALDQLGIFPSQAGVLDLSSFDSMTTSERAIGAAGHGGKQPSSSSWEYDEPSITPWRGLSGQQGIGAPLDTAAATSPPDTTIFGGTGSGGWSPGFSGRTAAVEPTLRDGHAGGYPGGGGGAGLDVFAVTPNPARTSGNGGDGAGGQIIVISI